jgi:hypothetical protein
MIVLAIIAVALAMPFGRRDDWLGWVALFTIWGSALFLWATLIVAFVRRIIEWYRRAPEEEGASGECVCYRGYIYELTWNRERFAVRLGTGRRVIDVPLDRVFDVIDPDAFFVEGEVTINRPGKVTFPGNKWERAKLRKLFRKLATSSSCFREETARRRQRYLRLGLIWLPVSLTLALGLVLPLSTIPDPPQLTVLWGLFGMAYGFAWYWLIWRFARAIALLGAARQLRFILRASD